MHYPRFVGGAVLATALSNATTPLLAQGDSNCDAACQAARKAANPLADIRAIQTETTIGYRSGTDKEDSYVFQLQPVYSVPLDGANLILRGVFPFMGVQPGAVLPPETIAPSPNNSLVTGLGDTILQAYYAPTPAEGAVSLGYGIQVSLPTRTDDSLAGAGWGAGPAFVLFGQTGDLSWGALLAHIWGENDFSVTTIQPILLYGFGSGWYVGYNNSLTYDWKAASDTEAWQIPLGLTIGRTIVLDEVKGTAMDVSLGWYDLDRKPKGGADSQIKFGLSYFF
ncbi:hypothetical protein QO034_21975 [Sedimentitalea sp. JM2-8]|uniref:MetA-pathway of phenol degradation n=1 Tax=Sedimentitalea xiamensis TaxID=3050037 RepID=A0ABT7FKN8_9RHOB|nr:hypothetical protein [Sedimentitalea xiamensis]MDK3075736.1 hypothetical protein [Sedimentitalea xiamensis]